MREHAKNKPGIHQVSVSTRRSGQALTLSRMERESPFSPRERGWDEGQSRSDRSTKEFQTETLPILEVRNPNTIQ